MKKMVHSKRDSMASLFNHKKDSLDSSTFEEVRADFEFNSRLGLNDFTEPNQQNPDPFITCTFITRDLIFVNLFHNHLDVLAHFHFIYDHQKNYITGNGLFEKIQIDCTR